MKTNLAAIALATLTAFSSAHARPYAQANMGFNNGLNTTVCTDLGCGEAKFDLDIYKSIRFGDSEFFTKVGNTSIGLEMEVSMQRISGINGGAGLIAPDFENGRLNVYSVGLNVTFEHPLPVKLLDRDLNIYFSLGGGYAYVENHDFGNTLSSTRKIGGSHQVYFSIGQGIEYRINDNLSIIGEVRGYTLPNVEFYKERHGDVSSIAGSLGFRWRF